MHHIRQQALLIASALLGVGLLAACGGGGGASPASSSSLVPANNQNPSLATASVTFSIPRPAGWTTTSAALRRPKFISPATNNMTILIDGQTAFNQVQVPYNATGPSPAPTNPPFTGSNGTTATLSGTVTPADFTWTLTVNTVPGNHTVGVVLLGDSATPHDVLSEGQTTVDMKPGSSSSAFLQLQGVVGSAYLTCPASFFANWNPATDNGTCNNYANFTPGSTPGSGGTYDFTVVAADTNGFPIVYQNNPSYNTPVPFDNGSVTIVNASPTILNVTVPTSLTFGSPGQALNDGPSGSWYLPGQFTYGQDIQIRCLQPGIGTIQLSVGGEPNPYPITGFDPASASPAATYPAGGMLPVGFQDAYVLKYDAAGDPTKVNNQFVPNVSVNCTSSLTMTVQ